TVRLVSGAGGSLSIYPPVSIHSSLLSISSFKSSNALGWCHDQDVVIAALSLMAFQFICLWVKILSSNFPLTSLLSISISHFILSNHRFFICSSTSTLFSSNSIVISSLTKPFLFG